MLTVFVLGFVADFLNTVARGLVWFYGISTIVGYLMPNLQDWNLTIRWLTVVYRTPIEGRDYPSIELQSLYFTVLPNWSDWSQSFNLSRMCLLFTYV